MVNKYQQVLALITLCSVGFLSGCATLERAQTLSKAGTEEIRPADEAKITGNYEAPDLADNSLDSVLAAPVPHFQLAFECAKTAGSPDCSSGSFTTEPPDTLQQAVKDFWKASLSFRYKALIQKNTLNRESYLALSDRYDSDCNEFEKRAEKVEINTPGG